ncbi:MAG: ATP-binding protein [Saprospiraceae bacterium]|nr:ATP-binding protein [Saprospiraceae bacterium]
MLVQFSVRNYKVFKEEAKLTLFASNYDKTTREQENVFEVPKFGLRLLKSAVIYGANASGKTKLIDAIHFMKDFILNSSKESQQGEKIDTEAFRLNTVSINEPSSFEVVFIHEDEMYRYGFEATQHEVVSEWLYHRPNTKEVEIFFREGQEFNVHARSFKKGSLLVKENMVRKNALMLSVAAQFNDKSAQVVLAWFHRFRQLSGLFEEDLMNETLEIVRQTYFKSKVLNMLQLADTSIEDFEITEEGMDLKELDEMPPFFKKFMTHVITETGLSSLYDVRTKHMTYDEQNQKKGALEFSMKDDESAGTAKYFAMTGSVVMALEYGNILIIDELDSKIHPNLIEQIVKLFNSKTTNPHNAQLIFNTHDTNLLGTDIFRRDQIWFVEKDRFGAASLYSLSSFKTDEGGRKTDNFEEKYLQGRYGGVPVLGDFSKILQPENGGAR